MATAEEILKKAAHRKKTALVFNPKKRRAWDFVFEKKEQKQENIPLYKNNTRTIKEQNRNNIGTKQGQKGNNIGTIYKQRGNEYGNKCGNKKEVFCFKKPSLEPHNHENKAYDHSQTDSEKTTEILCVMNGIQNKIMRQVISHIKNQPNKNYSIDIPIAVLAEKTNSSKESVRVSIKRLQKKNLLVRLRGEKGRYGNTKIAIPEVVVKKYFDLFNDPPCNINDKNSFVSITEQNGNKYGNISGNNSYSSSSYNIYKTTTTGDNEPHLNHLQSQLSEEWLNVDLEPLSNIGFTRTHLAQIVSQNKSTPQIVQDSIYAFAFDLQENDKAKSIKLDPISFFMGILRNGRVYTFPSNYESPQDKAMRIYRESKLKIERGRAEAEKEAIGLAFNEWFTKLTDEEKKEFLPELFRNNTNSEKLGKSKILESSARNHFEKEIWPDKKNEIIGKINQAEEQEEREVQ